MAEYDLILKALAEKYPEHFVTIVRGPGAEVEKIERLEKEAVATQRTSDILLKVTENGYEYVLCGIPIHRRRFLKRVQDGLKRK